MSLPTASEQIPPTRPPPNVSRDPGSRLKIPKGEVWDTFFVEDTCALKDSPDTIGVVAKTWHDIDDLDNWEEIDECVPGKYASDEDVIEFRSTGQPPRNYLLLTPSSPAMPSMLLHESELVLLDRALAFGDVVKKNLTSPLSGTVVSVSTSVGLRHSFVDPHEPTENYGLIPDVGEQELVLSRQWTNGDFVIYKNCWMGVVEEVFDEVAVRLQNGSVVVVENAWQLEIPVLSAEEEAQHQNINSLINGIGEGKAEGKPTGTSGRRPSRPKTIPSPYHLSAGQTVSTNKANLRRGRWLYGAYNASIPPIGVVVDVTTSKLHVTWLCQNIIVPGRFVPVQRPDMVIETEAEISKLKKFTKSVGVTLILRASFLRAWMLLKQGAHWRWGIEKISRSESLGFEINTFVVVETKTRVRVMWQDLTETLEEARGIVPYLNVDEHDVWPGEMVVIKEEPVEDKAKPSEIDHDGRQQFQGAWQYFNENLLGPSSEAVPVPDFIKPEKVGVVQTVNPAERVAKVIWFADPKVEIAGNIMIPGSKTGTLGNKVEDASLYEVNAHQAMGVRRGDFVLIAPEKDVSEEQGESTTTSAGDTTPVDPTNQQSSGGQLQQMADGLRGMIDGGLLANLSAALGTSNHPQFQAVSRMLSQFPLINHSENTNPPVVAPRNMNNEDFYLNQPLEWIGEVVDLGLDGLITVRLGALDEPKDIKASIERLHIIFTGEMDFDSPGDEDDEDDEYDSEESGSDEDDEFDDDDDEIWRGDDIVIDEQVYYQGGERIENDGGEEAWSTDDEADDMDFEDDSVVSKQPISLDYDGDTMMGNPSAGKDAEPVNEDKKEPTDDKILVPPPIPEGIPAPQAFSVPTSSKQLERFAILESAVPADHAFGGQPETPVDPKFLRRINKEHAILSSSLPDGILVRTWDRRIDLMRVLIIGPLNTPYELAPFVFDFHFSANFPHSPPLAHFHSWTGGIGRVNPNLYEDGKICLSLLGTWHAEKRNEGWSPNGSSVLQVLVSLMGLVLVREPYYNEAGFNVYVGSKDATLNSALYSEKAFILARGFVKHVLQRPVLGFEDEIKWLYMPGQSEGPELLKEVIKRAKEVVARSSAPRKTEGVEVSAEVGSEGVGRVSAGALVLLEKHLEALEGILEEGAGKTEVVSESA
ncbi:uncharacterized protein LAJ45_07178 [Morchella importuna]|uniref:uncharacterized protein n=1 Tax=Morchella importuna TaxID=1174673 RepID=UPI001E8CA488|nr:uncharacterized protein LAJ45_07178 [Morchella importuna]KAH8148835.1 hypothetical protein LAJ45_07178 [Morchella importuna]